MDNQIPIVNPTADREHHHKTLAGRALDLHGKTIGLLDNSKPNADEFLKSVGEFLQREYRGVRIVSRRKSNRTEADCLPELLQTCDAVVTAFAD